MRPVKLYWLHPLPLGVLAAVFLLVSGGIAWANMVLAGTMIVLGVLSGRRLSMRQQRAIAIAIEEEKHKIENAQHASATDFIASLERFCGSVIPVWIEQIEDARKQMENTIFSLVERFLEMTAKIENALAVSSQAAGGAMAESGETGLVAVFAQSETDLKAVVWGCRSTSSAVSWRRATFLLYSSSMLWTPICVEKHPASASQRPMSSST